MQSNFSYIIKDDTITFTTPYNIKFIDGVKEIPGRKYLPETKQWSCNINHITATPIRNLIEKFDVKNLSPEGLNTQSGGILLETNESALEEERIRLTGKLMNVNDNIKPRPYQIDNIHYMLTKKRVIDGSDMGTGKTFTSIFAVEVEDLFPCLVVVPSSLKYNWEMQWRRINRKREISVIENNNTDFDTDVVIINYDGLGKNVISGVDKKVEFKHPDMKGRKFKSVILDESQNIKNGKSVRGKIVRKITRGSEYIFMLTGTPIMNRPEELINPLTTLRVFDLLFGTWFNYVERYCDAYRGAYGWVTSGASNLIELNNKLREHCYVRVEKRDVLKDLPPVEETIFSVEIENRSTYTKAENDLILFLKENYGQDKADSAAQAEQLVLINTLRQLAVKGKLVYIHEWIDNFLESTDKKLIVFGVYTETLKELSVKYKSKFIYGGVSSKERQDIIDDFQENKTRVLFLNIMTGSTGIDGLQNVCSDLLFIELPWRYTDISQAIGRLERSGQTNNIGVNYLLGKDTIDHQMYEMIVSKRSVTDAVSMGVEIKAENYMKKLLESYLK